MVLPMLRRPNQTYRCPQPLSAHSSHKRVERATAHTHHKQPRNNPLKYICHQFKLKQ